MKIVIISDIHDNIVNLNNCLEWCKNNNIEAIFCCGDITNLDTIEFLANNFSNKIYVIRGNADNFEDNELEEVFENLVYFGRLAKFQLADFKIALCHEPFLIDELLLDDRPDLVFFGHTHKPWIEDRDGLKVINPGTLGGVFNLATFCFWDSENGNLELKTVN